MDARVYFALTDRIAAARTPAELDALRELVRATELHLVELRAIERVLRAREDAVRFARGRDGPGGRAGANRPG